ncbi:glycoside hydrolase family 38 C-terminal domain-containing protein [Agrococcus versicolor]|uniref:Glycoside hydrolase family 38 C-terminal domain-containing protein n=1 Tax=Agrococcus versicolor TaxID=501482 RepID=A0ABP5MRG0_9MICO
MRALASWLVGLPAEQPAAYRRLRAMRARIWRRVAPLQASILVSPEPTPFGDWQPHDFRPIRPGTAWGDVFECGWLHLTGPAASDPRAEVLLGIRGEALVHDAEGAVLDAVSTVYLQGDLPHPGGRYRTVRGVDATQPIDVYADATYNGLLIYPLRRAVFHGAHLAVRDATAYALYFDALTLTMLAGGTDDAALRRTLRAALDASWSRFRAGDLDAARAALAPALSAPSTSDLAYTAVGHGHLDMAWLWPLRETRRKAARTYARQLDAIERRPGYVYGTSQPQQMQWMRDEQPALFARLQAAVASGGMEAQGSFWIEPDTNLPSGESLIRQAVVGRRFLRRELGLGDDDLRLCWLPDTFGYSGALPQILRGTGMEWFQTIKLAWNEVNDFPHRTFRWAGIDGSEVLVHMPPEGDYNSRAAADGLLKGLRQHPERDLGTALLVYGGGDGGGGPSEVHHEVLDREVGAGIAGLPRVARGSASDFFRDLATRDVRHTHHGELYLEKHQGTYTTQAATKRWNRTLEGLLHDVEAIASAHGPATRAQVRDELEPVWQEALLQQFHDILPGSSIARVHRESVAAFERLAGIVEARIASLVDALPAAGDAPAALNLAPVPRDEPVRVDGTWMRARVAPYATAALVPEPEHPELVADATGLANGLLAARFDDATGAIVSLVDADGFEHAGEGLNRLVLHRDPLQIPFDAWDISRKAAAAPGRPLRVAERSWHVDGPRAVRRHVLVGPKVRIEQDVVLEAGSGLVRFETRVDWHQTHRMLRAEHRPTRYGDEALCEIQMGHIRRPTTERDSVERAQFEVCAHRWLAVEDATGGFALLNDGKYGHRAKHGLVSLALLRSPTFPDRTADRGTHAFAYAIRPYAPGALHEVVADGYRLQAPPRIVPGRADALAPLATVDDPGVVVETIAPAYDSDGVVVRLYESLGRATTTALTTSIPHRAAWRTDMLERPSGPADLSAIELGSFEIATLVLESP